MTVRGLARTLADMQSYASAEHALLCFSYRQSAAGQSNPTAELLEQLAHGETFGQGSGVIAMLDDAVLCLRTDCPLRSALQFARLVRSRLQTLHAELDARGWGLSIGILTIEGQRADPGVLIDLATEACEAAGRKGHSYIEVYRGVVHH